MMKSKYFKYYQPNKKDLKDKVGDCSIRAFTKALKMEWLEVFDSLYPYAREAQCLFNQKGAYEPFLKDRGWVYIPLKRDDKQTVTNFVSNHKGGTYILYIKVGFGTHLVTVEDGYFWDTWDCGQKYIYGYYIKEA